MFPFASGLLLATAVAALALGCHGGGTGADPETGVEVEVLHLGFDQAAGTPVVILREKAGTRMLPIWIGESEAQAILLKLHGIEPLRPLTSDLLKTVLVTTGNRVDRVVINDLRNQTFYATIYLDQARYRIDSRPSDAIALALACKVPIFVLPRLFLKEPPEHPSSPNVVLPQTRGPSDGAFSAVFFNDAADGANARRTSSGSALMFPEAHAQFQP
jgi:bifunctional DNase/RNase